MHKSIEPIIKSLLGLGEGTIVDVIGAHCGSIDWPADPLVLVLVILGPLVNEPVIHREHLLPWLAWVEHFLLVLFILGQIIVDPGVVLARSQLAAGLLGRL